MDAHLEAADREAAEQIDNHAQWADVHKQWEARTNRPLSPASFGRRILEVRENRIRASARSTPAEPRHPPAEHRNAAHSQPHPPAPHAPPSQPLSTAPHAPPPPHAHSGPPPPSQMRPSPLVHHHVPQSQPLPHHPPAAQPPVPTYGSTPPTHHSHPHHHTPALQPAPPGPHGARPPGDSLEQQRADILRIDNAILNLRHEMDVTRRSIDELRTEILKRSVGGGAGGSGAGGGSGGEYDAGTLDRLAESLSSVSSKAHEVDGLKFIIESLKKRVQVLEAASPATHGPPLAAAALKREPSHGTFPSSHHQSPAMPQHSHFSPHVAPSQAAAQSGHASPAVASTAPPVEVASSGWAAVNSSKRKASLEGTEDPTKRTRLHTDLPHEGGFAPVPAEIVHTPTYGQPRSVSGQEPYSHDTWQAKQYAPPGSAGRGALGAGRGRGRPRKPTPPDYGTPASWNDSEQWGAHDGETGRYAQVAAYESPSRSAERVDTGLYRGGLAGSEHPTTMRRTRQKPIRNADGILIRKDGKPDQRSISSAMNLKKVHARKMAELEMSSQGGGSPASTMEHSPTNGNGDMDSPARAKHSGDESTHGDEKEASAERENGSRDPHRQVLQKIFPRGVEDDADRYNHAGHIFNSKAPSHQPLQPRKDMAKDDFESKKSVEKDSERPKPAEATNGALEPSPLAANPEHVAQAVSG